MIYLFKCLPLNRRIRGWDGQERLAPYRHEFYFQRWHFDAPMARQAEARAEARFPTSLQHASDDASLFQVELRRTFPLYHEGDNQQRLIPQRLIGWSPPATDLEVLRVYQGTPPRLKLNRELFLRCARLLLAGSPLLWIPDANTGTPLDAPAWWEALCWQWIRIERKCRAVRRSLASDGSWPDWSFYYCHSPSLERYWARSVSEMEDLFLRVLGWRRLPRRPAEFPPGQHFLFVSLLTLKLWWLHRACSDDSPE